MFFYTFWGFMCFLYKTMTFSSFKKLPKKRKIKQLFNKINVKSGFLSTFLLIPLKIVNFAESIDL